MSVLPSVTFCGLNLTRLLIGANPFVGGSHQTLLRNKEMLSYYTRERIIETWFRAESAGINAMVTNNESPGILETVSDYYKEGGRLQWIAQVNIRQKRELVNAIDEVIQLGCTALFLHGSFTDRAYANKDEDSLRAWCPSRLMTRATLMPPPPASRCTAVQRSFRVGSTWATDVATSIAGFMVTVTISLMLRRKTALRTRDHRSSGYRTSVRFRNAT